MKKFNSDTYEILEHAEKPGFRNVFHIILCVAVVYFIFIFAQAH